MLGRPHTYFIVAHCRSDIITKRRAECVAAGPLVVGCHRHGGGLLFGFGPGACLCNYEYLDPHSSFLALRGVAGIL